MIKNIVTSFDLLLTAYIEQKGRSTKAAQELKSKLKSIKSLDEFKSIIKSAVLPKSNFFNFLSLTKTPDPFDHYLKNTLKKITDLNTAFAEANDSFDRLEKIRATGKSMALIRLLKKLLVNPQSFFYIEMLNVLNYLKDIERFETLLMYLESLPDKPRLKEARQGTHDAIKPLDDDHRICLELLRNNCTDRHKNSDDFNAANVLLQYVTVVYEALHWVNEVSFTVAAKRASLGSNV